MGGVTNTLSDGLRLLGCFLAPKLLTARLLNFARDEGIFRVMGGMSEFTKNTLCHALRQECDYLLDDPVKRRMVSVLLDFLYECGVFTMRDGAGGPFYTLSGNGEELSGESLNMPHSERELYEKFLKGQVEFLSKCVDEAGNFLRGGQSPFDFSKSNRANWEMFLGNYEFRTMRTLLLRLMNIPDRADVKVLDLCFGLGHGVSDILQEYGKLQVRALDKCGAYIDEAKSRIEELRNVGISDADVRWMYGQWGGFSSPLPFEDNFFEAVHFACSDPYIPGNLRETVYREIHRVLKPGGVLGVLTWLYPKRKGTVIGSPWIRRQILAHDFAESVCLGWQGFSCIEETMEMYARLGFVEDELSASFCGEITSQSICVVRKS